MTSKDLKSKDLKENIVWVNVYGEKDGRLFISGSHYSKQDADYFADNDRVGCMIIRLKRGF